MHRRRRRSCEAGPAGRHRSVAAEAAAAIWYRRVGAAAADPISLADVSVLHTDGRAGLYLQRDLLHLRAGAQSILWRVGRSNRALYAAFCRREFPRPTATRSFLRYAWATADDRG